MSLYISITRRARLEHKLSLPSVSCRLAVGYSANKRRVSHFGQNIHSGRTGLQAMSGPVRLRGGGR